MLSVLSSGCARRQARLRMQGEIVDTTWHVIKGDTDDGDEVALVCIPHPFGRGFRDPQANIYFKAGRPMQSGEELGTVPPHFAASVGPSLARARALAGTHSQQSGCQQPATPCTRRVQRMCASRAIHRPRGRSPSRT